FICMGVMITIGLAMLRQYSLRQTASIIFMIGIPILVLVGSYLMYNLALYGHYYPVSGLIKRPEIPGTIEETLAQLLWPISPLYNRIGLFPSVVAICILGLLFGLIVLFIQHLRTLAGFMLRRYDWLWIGAVALYVYISLSKTLSRTGTMCRSYF